MIMIMLDQIRKVLIIFGKNFIIIILSFSIFVPKKNNNTYSDSSSKDRRLIKVILAGRVSRLNSSPAPSLGVCRRTTSSRNFMEWVRIPSLSLSIMFRTSNWGQGVDH